MDWIGTIAVFVAASSAVWALIERSNKFKAVKDAENTKDLDGIIAVKDEFIKSVLVSSNDYKARWKDEHDEYVKYREYVHEQNGKHHSENLLKAERIAELEAKTSMVPLIEKFTKTESKLENLYNVSIQNQEVLAELLQILGAKTDRSIINPGIKSHVSSH